MAAEDGFPWGMNSDLLQLLRKVLRSLDSTDDHDSKASAVAEGDYHVGKFET